RGADFFCAAGGVSACSGGLAACAAGVAASCEDAAGRSFAAGTGAVRCGGSSIMMLTGGIEVAEGSSYLSAIGARVSPLDAVFGTDALAGAEGAAACGAAGCGAAQAAA